MSTSTPLTLSEGLGAAGPLDDVVHHPREFVILKMHPYWPDQVEVVIKSSQCPVWIVTLGCELV